MANEWTWLTNWTALTDASTTGAWTDLDLSAILPSGTKAVAIRIQNRNAAQQGCGVRANGSTDGYVTCQTNSDTGRMVKVDANRVIEYYIGSTDCKLYLVAYSDLDYVFTNRSNRTDGWNSWTDVDLSALIASGSVGAMLSIVGGSSGSGVRKNGSSGGWIPSDTYRTGGAGGMGVAVDTNRIFELYRQNNTCAVEGYFKSEAYFLADIVDVTPSTGAYNDVDISAYVQAGDTPTGVILCGGRGWPEQQISVRKNGSTDDFYAYTYCRQSAWFCGVDENKKFEAKMSGGTLYLIGYTKATPASGWTHKINGVAAANMAKVDAVAKANIAKIMGA